jgi:SEC-C motif
MEQTPDDLTAHLAEQLRFLRESAESFDRGFEGEAKRLAVTLRTLLHDTASSRSLLGQLGERDRLYYDTAMHELPDNLFGHGALVEIVVSLQGSKYVALLDDPLPDQEPVLTLFEDWWNRVVFRTQDNQKLSRRSLVLALANQDGGAHVDPKLDAAYAAISRENAMGWTFTAGEVTYAIRAPELAAGRQVAHEVIKTFDPQYTKRPELPPGGLVLAGGGLFQMSEEEARRLKPKAPEILPSPRSYSLKPPVGRNELCPCGSKKKFKKCHGR